MHWNRISLWAFSSLLLITFTACENPGNVGEGLVGGLNGTPEAEVVLASTSEADTVRDITGNADRVMAGRVVDPMLGTMAATGYVDFSRPNNPGSDFTEGPATYAELRLRPDYTYGSTTVPVTFRLNAIREEISTSGAMSDTTIEADVIGDFVTEFSVNPSDTLVIVPLPDAFVTANDTTFRSTNFNTSFHGFQISSTGSDAIRGFDAEGNLLRIVSGEDTVNFGVSRQLTTLARESEPVVPEGYVLLQDGFGEAVTIDFPFEDAGFGPSAINRAAIALSADTLATQANAPAGFIRPLLGEVSLYSLSEDGTASRLGFRNTPIEFVLEDDGRFILDHQGLISIIQSRLEGDEISSGFRITPDVESNTINPILIYTGDLQSTPDKNEAPQAALTFTPIE